ncbi:FAD-dependent oxidoreductase [Nocardioides sp. AE5]|uniref:FAD-dependent oxidoreductase n=1 Tax=Nocardioides sp. AE5 TaxID=2962573 RepID=UPI0028824027|nr:FAD-dependent oxidoreductase [Nocardioides sp. AE5]MDT0203819.1 FAD-dependent oxidoreductase [Nocardioides sp. AE5]
MRNIRAAVVGAGPAGIYAADILTKEYEQAEVDVFDRLPAPYGLVRYGVAPDHPRIKEIIKALGRVLANDRIRFLGNVELGGDVKLADLHHYYDAVIVATGAASDRNLELPGSDLPGSYGAADFVSWYAGHPDVPRDWPLEAESVAVIGAGNVGLDVARMLAKPVTEQLTTEIAENVERGLAANKARDVHVFARRGPAQVKFSPMELRELSHSPSVDVLVEEDGFQIDEASQALISSNKGVRLVVDTLLKYLEATPTGAPHRIHIHLCHAPVALLGDGKVQAIRTERTELDGTGNARGTGEYVDTPVQAVYRAVGYLSTHLPDLPFDHVAGVIPNQAGRVLDLDGVALPGVYATGWIKRGPVGLIGHTKSDAAETIRSLLEDLDGIPAPEVRNRDAILDHLADRGVDVVTHDDWLRLDAHEIALGEASGRERIKVVPRDAMIAAARSEDTSLD